ncbi:MAG: D-alanyl-D-alanine carboxypeptidase [Streptosporangiales bacterium]|nr:D-alanyl-D-alanine carboxypeptidase [Streptosporangiales bacterium]
MPTNAHRARSGTRGRMGAFTALMLCVCAVLALGPPGASASPGKPVGGPLLGSRGVISPKGGGVPPLPATKAASYLVTDLDTGQVLAAKDPHGRYAPASTLKVLTALTAFPHIHPGQQVRPTYADMTVDGTRVGIDRRRTYSARDLCLAMLMMSANDATEAVARTAGGGGSAGRARTIAAMNAKARHLQAYDTQAHNPTGLDAAGQTSSAYDLSLFFRAAMQRNDFRAYLHARTAQFPTLTKSKTYQIASHNHLLWQYRGDLGGKNGFTEKARASYVGAARRGGHTIAVALLHEQPNLWPDATNLLNWGFAARGKAEPVGRLVSPTSASAAASPSPSPSGSHGETTVTGTHVRTGPPAWVVPAVFAAVLLGCGLLALGLAVRQRARRAARRARTVRRAAIARAQLQRTQRLPPTPPPPPARFQPPPPPPPPQPRRRRADTGISIAHPIWPSDAE